jgi:hypothetical protein
LDDGYLDAANLEGDRGVERKEMAVRRGVGSEERDASDLRRRRIFVNSEVGR